MCAPIRYSDAGLNTPIVLGNLVRFAIVAASRQLESVLEFLDAEFFDREIFRLKHFILVHIAKLLSS